jgi:predicted kinase
MPNKHLVLCVGLPKSGKTSWARKKTAEFPIVDPDSIRLALHGQSFIPEAEPMVWIIAHYMVEALFLSGHDTVVLDSCNISKKRRNEWKSDKWTRKYKLFQATKDVCIERAKKDGKEYLIEAIERMSAAYEPVEEEEWDGHYSKAKSKTP